MVPLASLWLPILLSAVLVFLASSLLHMVLRYHRTDFAKIPNEDAIMDVLRPVPPGDYMIPYASGPIEMKDPVLRDKMARGPIVVLTIMGEGMSTAFKKSLALWFVYSIVVSTFAAYVAGRARGPGTEYMEVFRFVGTAAFLGYALAMAQQSIWYGRKWSTTFKSMVDGLIYALLTAGVFGWLWPK
ncbi:MAG: hypothetical protein WD825_00515 [Gemmatimonadaceae bacterium]